MRDGAQSGARLEQVGGPAMAERMRGDALADPAPGRDVAPHVPDGLAGDRLPRCVALEEGVARTYLPKRKTRRSPGGGSTTLHHFHGSRLGRRPMTTVDKKIQNPVTYAFSDRH